jgi:hypothetical protein
VYDLGSGDAESFSLGVKRLGLEADYSPPSMIEVKNVWICTFIAPYVFMAWYLIKHRMRLHGVVVMQL